VSAGRPERPRPNPTHRSELREPHGRVTIYETLPVGREPGKFYCKYCYRTHRQWWRMDDAEYSAGPTILCGYCEHTSLIEYAMIDEAAGDAPET